MSLCCCEGLRTLYAADHFWIRVISRLWIPALHLLISALKRRYTSTQKTLHKRSKEALKRPCLSISKVLYKNSKKALYRHLKDIVIIILWPEQLLYTDMIILTIITTTKENMYVQNAWLRYTAREYTVKEWMYN